MDYIYDDPKGYIYNSTNMFDEQEQGNLECILMDTDIM